MELDPALLKFAAPEYGSASLSDVLPSALSILDAPDSKDVLDLAGDGLAGVRRVVVLLIDGLGYHQYRQAATGSALLADAVAGRRGRLRRLTTNFPSTTPTSLTSLGVGVPPGQHGVLGFTVNVPGTQDVLVHILWGEEPDPQTWQPVTTCFQRAAEAGIGTGIVSPIYPFDGLSQAAFRGAERYGAQTVPEIVDGVRQALDGKDRALVYAYYPVVDKMGHLFGVDSAQWHAEVANVDRMLSLLLADLPSDTALLVTADHGMVNIPQETRIDIGRHPRLREGVRMIMGEPRARYVHTEPGAEAAVAANWRDVLGERAEVLTRAQAIQAGWFGPVDPAHADRIGDLVVACRGRYAILGAPEADSRDLPSLKGLHGSLTEAEMAIPLWINRGMS